MTDELKFYDPITRKPWHHAKEGAKITNDAPWVIVRGDGIFNTYNHERTVGPGEVIFTREPIAPPKPPKPTDPYLGLKPFRHPSISGKAECPECGHPFETHGWLDQGSHGFTVRPFDFTPTEPETPPLPTEPGALIRAVDTNGDECATMIRLEDGDWFGVDQDGDYRFWDDESIREWGSVTLVPSETWDRLRLLDPEDTRDRVDSGGGIWRYGEGRNCWGREDGTFLYGLEVVDRHYGPLRFADEVSGDE